MTEAEERDVLPFVPVEAILNREGRERVLQFYVNHLKYLDAFPKEGGPLQSTPSYDPTRIVTSAQAQIADWAKGIEFPEDRLVSLIVGYQNSGIGGTVAEHDRNFAARFLEAAREHCSFILVRQSRFRNPDYSFVDLGYRVQNGKDERGCWRWFGAERPNLSARTMHGIRAIDYQVHDDLVWAAEYHLGFKPTEVRKVWSRYVELKRDAVCSPEIHDWNVQGGLWNIAKQRAIRSA